MCCDLIQRWRRGFSVYDIYIYIARAWVVYGDSLAWSAEEKAGHLKREEYSYSRSLSLSEARLFGRRKPLALDCERAGL